MRKTLDPHAALIYTMVLVSVAEGQISDVELETMGRLVQTLPVFETFDKSRIVAIGDECRELLGDVDGIDLAIERIAGALTTGLCETAYVLACDIVAADGKAAQDELRLLELLRNGLGIDRLAAAAIERAAQARHRVS
ncbi:MAG: tellurite resistance TerB family protein [Geminicoccaceae bacterium]|nr:tellurite resistance TerB family protein [Geminicoccaceae bacterium]MCB9943724.1 tellurite resistance TerB family protein [Geminicoccaceae bacterium]